MVSNNDVTFRAMIYIEREL